MRFNFNFLLNQGIYQLHSDILQFFQSAINLARFNGVNLLTPALRNLVAESDTLGRKFKAVFRELNRNAIDKQLVYNSLINNNNVRQLINDSTFPLQVLPSPLYDNVNISIKNLYDWLWYSTIKTKGCDDNYGSIQDHYVLFDQLNYAVTKRLCPFCGLEKLTNPKEKRNEYDHYLNRALYPYLAINFVNLVPMCDRCNKAPNKGSQNMIIDQDNGTRRPAYFVYDPVEAFSINLDCQNIFSITETWTVQAMCNNMNHAFETWKHVFRIDFRYSNYLKAEYEGWLINFGAYFSNTIPNGINELRQRITQYYNFRIACALSPGDFLEFQFWTFFGQLSDPDLGLFFDFLQQRNAMLNN
jgi:hypothetical protein